MQTLPESDLMDAIKQVAPTLTQIDVAGALDWAQSLSTANARQIAMQEVVGRWADNQPQEAARWVLAEPDGAMRLQHVRTVATQWLAEDPQSAVSWVQTLPA